jgi:hypothetical protein
MIALAMMLSASMAAVPMSVHATSYSYRQTATTSTFGGSGSEAVTPVESSEPAPDEPSLCSATEEDVSSSSESEESSAEESSAEKPSTEEPSSEEPSAPETVSVPETVSAPAESSTPEESSVPTESWLAEQIEKVDEALEDDRKGGEDDVELIQTATEVEVLIEEPTGEVEIDLTRDEWNRFVQYEEEYHPEELVIIEDELLNPHLLSFYDSAVFLEELEEFFIEEETVPLAEPEAAAETAPVSSVPKTGVATVSGLAGALMSLGAALGLKKRRK